MDEIGNHCLQVIGLAPYPMVLNRHVLAFDVAGLVEAFAEGCQQERNGIGRPEVDEPDHPIGDLDGGLAFINRSIAINPNFASAWQSSGYVKIWRGEHDAGIADLARAMRLSPFDPQLFLLQGGIACAHLFAGRYDQAAYWADMASREKPTFAPSFRVLAAGNALLGRIDEARQILAKAQELDPTRRLSYLEVPKQARGLEILKEGLRRAGLPE